MKKQFVDSAVALETFLNSDEEIVVFDSITEQLMDFKHLTMADFKFSPTLQYMVDETAAS